MSTYELPDGFQGMESLPQEDVKVNVLYADGAISPNHTGYLRKFWVNSERIGWSPIVPPKKKRRFVVKGDSGIVKRPYYVRDTMADNIVTSVLFLPTRESAQAVADIYEQAYEGGV
jgi:hypothetical protein